MAESGSDQSRENAGKGLALPGLIIGLLTGLAAYGVVEYWIDGKDDSPLAVTVLFFIITTSAAYLLLAESGKFIKSLGGALFIAALLAGPDFYMAGIVDNETINLTNFPAIFWFIASRGLAAYLLVTLVKF